MTATRQDTRAMGETSQATSAASVRLVGFAARCEAMERVNNAIANETAICIHWNGYPYVTAADMDAARMFIGDNRDGIYSLHPMKNALSEVP